MKGYFLSKEEDDARRDCWKRGLIDKEAAKERCISKETFHQWRTSRGLTANGGSGRGGRRVNTKYWRANSVIQGQTTNR